MKKSLLLMALLGVVCSASAAPQPDATDLVRRADMKRRGTSSTATMTMTVERPGWTRAVSMRLWSLGTTYSLVLITAPAKEKGQSFLKRGNEMWSYVPSIDRIVKMPPSMMGQSWMGSDFTNDDLLKESSIVQDYTHTIAGLDTIDSKECWRIRLLPRENAVVVWGKLLVWITRHGDDMVRVERYDEDGALMSTETSSNLRKFGNRVLPTHSEMVPAGKKGNRTVLDITDAAFDAPLEESFFSQQNMKRLR